MSERMVNKRSATARSRGASARARTPAPGPRRGAGMLKKALAVLAVSGLLDFRNESLISIDLEEVKAALEALPWIRKADLRREWPRTLIIEVEEQVPIARWSAGSLLNQQGQVFRPPETRQLGVLPTLSGPAGSERAVMEQYQKFNQLLYPLGMKVAALDMNSRGAWRLELDNGVEIRVGKERVMERMRRLVSFLDAPFLEGMAAVRSIDLRYSDGIAVSRRTPEENGEVVSL